MAEIYNEMLIKNVDCGLLYFQIKDDKLLICRNGKEKVWEADERVWRDWEELYRIFIHIEFRMEKFGFVSWK